MSLTDDIKWEMAEIYRKQKEELLKLKIAAGIICVVGFSVWMSSIQNLYYWVGFCILIFLWNISLILSGLVHSCAGIERILYLIAKDSEKQ